MSKAKAAAVTLAHPTIAEAIAKGQPYFIEGADRPGAYVINVDHATNFVPAEMNRLGLSEVDLCRHIAWDIGAAGVGFALGEILDAPVVGTCFSRLVIDPNRGADDPTLVMRLYDKTVIPGNHRVNKAETEARISRFWQPYHDALAALMAKRGPSPTLVAVHSFTEQLRDRPPRPWHVGILHAGDHRLSTPLLARLNADPDIVVGDNEPYAGHLPGDTVDRHALAHGHYNVLLELRQDLIVTRAEQRKWAEYLAPQIDASLREAKIKSM